MLPSNSFHQHPGVTRLSLLQFVGIHSGYERHTLFHVRLMRTHGSRRIPSNNCGHYTAFTRRYNNVTRSSSARSARGRRAEDENILPVITAREREEPTARLRWGHAPMRRLLALTEAVYGGKLVLQQQHQPGCSCQAQPLHLHRVQMRSCTTEQ